VLAVLAVAAVVLALFFYGSARTSDLRAERAEAERDQARAQVQQLQQAAKRDDAAATATDTARSRVAEQVAQHHDRAKRV